MRKGLLLKRKALSLTIDQETSMLNKLVLFKTGAIER